MDKRNLLKHYTQLLRYQANFLEALLDEKKEAVAVPEPACPDCHNTVHQVAIYNSAGTEHYACPHCEFRGLLSECYQST